MIERENIKKKRSLDLLLIGIAVLSAFLNIYGIWREQYANAYYTSAVTSMLQSFHNFFFASFDPAGFVSVDKPPLVFWIQTLFAYVFGVHGWSVILPQALAGIGSVWLIYALVKPSFGTTAARLAGLIMACTPIAVAVSRTNNIDSMLVFALLLAAWMLFRAVRGQSVAWVLGAFAMIGIGFNMKMLQAYMVVPAFFLYYLLAFKCRWKKKLSVLAAAAVIMVVISLSWAVIVDSVPQSNRPYVGGSKANSVLELAFGYNGMERLTGMNRGMGGGPGAAGRPNRQRWWNENDGRPSMPDGLSAGGYSRTGFAPDGSMPMPPGGSKFQGFATGDDQGRVPLPGFSGAAFPGRGMNRGGMFGTGQPGPLRLFQSELSGQISWLLPLVFFACIAWLAGVKRRKPLTGKQEETFFWLGWLLPDMVFFSIAGFFHQYYLIMLAPPIAALAGTGWVELWQRYRNREGWQMWLLPAALLVTTAFQLYILLPYRDILGWGWLSGIGAAGTGLALALILAVRLEKPLVSKMRSGLAAAGILVLLVAPFYWSLTPILYGDNSSLPQAGPSQQAFGQRQGRGDGMNSGINEQLLAYVTSHNTGEKFLFATTSAATAEPYIIKTGKAVMAMGGFSGSDPILTVKKLEQLVKDGQVKYFLISDASNRGRADNNEVYDWIRSHSTKVPRKEWQGDSTLGFQGGPMGMGNETLYQIKL